MPKDIRRLVFSHNETADALRVYGESYKIEFPKGKIIQIRWNDPGRDRSQSLQIGLNQVIERKPTDTVAITFYDDAAMSHKIFNLTAEFVTKALIQYCISNKIMLPKEARKQIDVTELNLCLDITFSGLQEKGQELSLEDE